MFEIIIWTDSPFRKWCRSNKRNRKMKRKRNTREPDLEWIIYEFLMCFMKMFLIFFFVFVFQHLKDCILCFIFYSLFSISGPTCNAIRLFTFTLLQKSFLRAASVFVSSCLSKRIIKHQIKEIIIGLCTFL